MGDTNSLDLAGLTVNGLTVIERTSERRGTSVMWRCACVCGETTLIRANILRAGRIHSCGCQTNAILSKARSTHGLSKVEAKTFRVWRNLRDRCQNPRNTSFNDYGGRGISVCDRWASFANFFADMGRCPDGMSIDRIEVNGNYEPGNCRWATAKTQCNNRRNNKVIEHDGQRLTMQQWSELAGIRRDTFEWRLDAGWSMERALSQPIKGSL